MNNKENNIWIFVDETGTSSLEDKSNPIFGLGFLISGKPTEISKAISEVKYNLWLSAPDNHSIKEFFHATNDPKIVRLEFYKRLSIKNLKFNGFHFFYLDKGKLLYNLPPYYKEKTENLNYIKSGWLIEIYNLSVFLYVKSISQMLKRNYKNHSFQLNFVLSSIFTKKETIKLTRVLEDTVNNFFENEELSISLNIYWVDNKTDYCCQLADYFTWTVNRKIVKNEDVGFSFLESKTFSKHDITDNIIRNYKESEKNLDNKNTPPMESSFRRET